MLILSWQVISTFSAMMQLKLGVWHSILETPTQVRHRPCQYMPAILFLCFSSLCSSPSPSTTATTATSATSSSSSSSSSSLFWYHSTSWWYQHEHVFVSYLIFVNLLKDISHSQCSLYSRVKLRITSIIYIYILYNPIGQCSESPLSFYLHWVANRISPFMNSNPEIIHGSTNRDRSTTGSPPKEQLDPDATAGKPAAMVFGRERTTIEQEWYTINTVCIHIYI